MGGILGFVFVALFLFGPVWLVFTLVFAAVKAAFKLTFWVLQAVIGLLAFLLGGGLLAFAVIFIVANIIALPCRFLFSRRRQ